MKPNVLFKSLLLCALFHFSYGWNNDELELFDIVEEVNQNFYELLEIPPDAPSSDARKAYRRLSLILHPDKNPAPDADVKFRQLVAVYEVIKDPVKRQRYDEVLVNGLPDWRSAVYYYRRVRKMGMAELSVILFVIVTVGQYLVGWGSYLEKRFIAEDFVSTKMKKQTKKSVKKGKADTANVVEEVMKVIPTPSMKDTLPFQIPRFMWWCVTGLPVLIRDELEERKRQQEEQRLLEEEERAAEEAAAAAAAEKAERGPKKRKGGGFVLPEMADGDNPTLSQAQILAKAKREMKTSLKKPAQSGGLWTDEDIQELIKLVKKYPTGTLERWEKIADAMERSVPEVTHMAHKVKEEGYRAPTQEKGNVTNPEMEDLALMGKSKKVKTRGGKLGVSEADPTMADENGEADIEASWNQIQQKALEAALIKFPKGSTQDRWEKIAKCVPDKTKEECMIRFKYLADMVKKKREREAEAAESTPVSEETTETGVLEENQTEENCGISEAAEI